MRDPRETRKIARVRVLAKYLALQLPGWVLAGGALVALHDWGFVSGWAGIGLWGLWLAKDFALYPLLRHAYGDAPSRHVGVDVLEGAQGVAEDELAPAGLVRVNGELWRAELSDWAGAPISAGTRIRVREVRGLTLRVDAVP